MAGAEALEGEVSAVTPYYERNGITIYCGDCLEVMPGLAGPVDAIITDLPYGTTSCDWDTVIPFEPLWSNYKRLIKRAGAVVLFGGEPFSSLLRVSNLAWYRESLIWEKEKPTNFMQLNHFFGKVTEDIIVFSDSMPTYNPQKYTVNYRIKNKPKGVHKSIVSANSGKKVLPYNDNGSRFPTNIIRLNRVALNNYIHHTQKPVALLAYLIRTYTNPGELILDNTAGSGTTLVAAQTEGRRGIGIEISEEYCKIAVDRLRQPSFFSLPNEPKPAAVNGHQVPMFEVTP